MCESGTEVVLGLHAEQVEAREIDAVQRELQVPLEDLTIYALGRHLRLVKEAMEAPGSEEALTDLQDRALCQRSTDIDLELLRRTPTTPEEREVVLAALERVGGDPVLPMAAVARMGDDLRAGAA